MTRRQIRKWNPGDAANVFVRTILSDAGTVLGGFTVDEWERTREYFEGRCAYTGVVLQAGNIHRDHAIPMNRTHCGVHLFGNVLPTTKAVNTEKGSRHYREFIGDKRVLAKVETFIADAGYSDRVALLGDLQHYCAAQYRAIDALCRINREYLQSLLPKADSAEAKEHADDPGGQSLSLANDRLRHPQSGLAREAYCQWLCHVVRKDDFGRTVGLPYEEVVEQVKAAGHPNASVKSAMSHATHIRKGTRGCAGHKLPDTRPATSSRGYVR